jgi:hypothetical protein
MGMVGTPPPEQVESFLADVRLLTYREMQALFPDCVILRERILGITKSYVAIRTAPHPSPIESSG